MNKRFVSLWFRHLLTDWLALRRPELKDLPFVLAAPVQNRIIVTAANHLAEAQGVTAGMAAADAKALVLNLQVIDDIPGQAAKLLKALGEWCIRYSPLIAIDMPGGLLLDVSGCTHLWGGERGYLKEIITRLRSKGYDVRGAMADTVGAAWAVARFGRVKPIIEPGEQVSALLDLSPAALRLEPVILDRLQKLGFYTIKSFINTGRSALRRRFGDNFLLRLHQALGNVDEPLSLLHPIEPYTERLPCLEPIRTRTGIEIAIKTLLENICKRLAGDGKGIRTAILKGYRVDGEVVQVQIGTNRASHNIAHLFKLFELKIELIRPKLGIELFTLEAPKVDDVEPEQEALWSPEGCGMDDAHLANCWIDWRIR
jgi:protein ImuB